ncbi:MAG: hypothetical protein K5985_05340 [Lachnospiraceae bacterium]|nr:hypothetical protein [Lachnospiraceae bacterium]
MKIFDWFRDKFKRRKLNEEDDDYSPISRSSVDIRIPEEREHYVRSCCEQMIEAGEQIERATMEYRLVTDYLTDIEELDKTPYETKAEAIAIAESIVRLEQQTASSSKTVGRIAEEEYQLLDRYADDVPGEIEKMKENEEYKALVRGDLRTLESEKAVTNYRRNEMLAGVKNMKNMAGITVTALVAAILLLTVLQFSFSIDSTAGYVASGAIAAVALTVEFMSFRRFSAERKKAERYLNRVIVKQNSMKVRYVNVTNLLEYEYSKYRVNNSDELKYFWDLYIEEKKARDFLERAGDELEISKRELVNALRKVRLRDPAVWANQCRALTDAREMVEIRHDLRLRREALRDQIEYNTGIRDEAKNEINILVKRYPEYAREILGIVSAYGEKPV